MAYAITGFWWTSAISTKPLSTIGIESKYSHCSHVQSVLHIYNMQRLLETLLPDSVTNFVNIPGKLPDITTPDIPMDFSGDSYVTRDVGMPPGRI